MEICSHHMVGRLGEAILLVFLRNKNEWLSATEIRDALNPDGVESNVLYPALWTLRDGGFLECSIEAIGVGTRVRAMFRITSRGRQMIALIDAYNKHIRRGMSFGE